MSSSSSSDEYDPREALEEIDNDLTVLENVLKPLLEAGKPWTDVLDTLSNMEQAKMGMIMAYGVCDLIWIFLRLKGIDPSSHPVMKELDRIKTYYIKVRDAENPPKKANKVDIAAAGRFITAAIPRAQRLDSLDPSASPSAAPAATATTDNVSENGEKGPTSTRVEPTEEEVVREVGKHSRFKLLAQDSVPEKLSVDGMGGDDGEEIRVVHETSAAPTSRRKGKRVAAEDFLDSPGSEGTKKAKGGDKPAAAAASVAEGSAGKTRKSRKSTSKRSS